MKEPRKVSENYSEKETKQRFDAMLKGALKSPPKPMKSIKTKKKKSEQQDDDK